MHEQIVAERHAELQIPEKAKMRLGQRLGKSLAPSLCRRAELREPLRVDAVGAHGLFAAIHQPMIEAPGIVEKIEQNGLVIALEEMRVETLRQVGDQPLDHASAIGAAIDIIAEEDERAPARHACLPVHRARSDSRGLPASRAGREYRPPHRGADPLAVSDGPSLARLSAASMPAHSNANRGGCRQ